MLCLHLLAKKKSHSRIESDFISQGMRFKLNNLSIQKKEVKLENERNGYFFVFTVLMNTSWDQRLMINIYKKLNYDFW